MLESVASTMIGADSNQIGWSHSRADIVDAVDALLSTITKEGETAEELTDAIEELLKTAAEAVVPSENLIRGLCGGNGNRIMISADGGVGESSDWIRLELLSVAPAAQR